MFTSNNQVTTRPNPFVSIITVEVSTPEDQNGVVRMCSEDGKIVQLFLWQLKKGINISNISNLSRLSSGMYLVDVLDKNGGVICSTRITK